MLASQIPQGRNYTYADMLCWDEQEHMELIQGMPVMTAGASRDHQFISGRMFAQLSRYLDGKKCEVYYAPFDVRLFESEEDRPEDVDTVVEPDLLVVCDPSKLDQSGCRGAPDMIVEILSPSTRARDRLEKFKLYQEAGVREYWIVSPEEKTVQVFLLAPNGLFVPHAFYEKTEQARVNVLESCHIDLSGVFPE